MAKAVKANKEKRRDPRFNCLGQAQVFSERNQDGCPARIVDISTTGCLVISDRPLGIKPGQQVEMGFTINQLVFSFKAEVKVVRSQTTLGVEFQPQTKRGLQLLEDLVDEVAADVRKAESIGVTTPRPRMDV